MTRYHYTCPLQAAYMAKEFGMRILATHHGEQIDTHGNCIAYCEHEFGWESPFYIRPDSLHLLEPQVGDIVLNCDDDPARVIRDGKNFGHYEVPLGEAKEHVGRNAIIIHRNGKPFFWPEVE